MLTTLPTGHPLYKGEAMLLNWSDSASRGMTVTFALNPADEGTVHPFRHMGTGKHGQRFAIVAVPITDDERPAKDVHTMDAPAEPKPKVRTPFDQLPRSQQAAMLCQEDRAFWRYLGQRHDGADTVSDSYGAAIIVRNLCEAQSRSLFDTDPEAGKRWDALHAEFKRWAGREQEVR